MMCRCFNSSKYRKNSSSGYTKSEYYFSGYTDKEDFSRLQHIRVYHVESNCYFLFGNRSGSWESSVSDMCIYVVQFINLKILRKIWIASHRSLPYGVDLNLT